MSEFWFTATACAHCFNPPVETLRPRRVWRKPRRKTATEECWYKYDPSFRDWVDNFQGKVRHGDLTMKKAYRLHRAAWPNAPRMDRESMRGRPARCRGLAPFTSKTEFD